MDERVVAFLSGFEAVFDDCIRFACMARGRELQVESVERLRQISENSKQLKAEVVAELNEEAANALLSVEMMAVALESELSMWIALKDDDPNTAWKCLIDAQNIACGAIRASSIKSDFINYCHRLQLLEKVLFPPQMFMSAGLIIRESKCSICGKEYGECGHIKGRAYMGQMCARKITKWDALEISYVYEPADKRCRAISFIDGKVTRDFMTYREIPAVEAKDDKLVQDSDAVINEGNV